MDQSKLIESLGRHAGLFTCTSDGLGERLLTMSVDENKAQFTAGLQPDGTVQPPLSHKYAEWKEKYFPDRPILVLTGLMRDGLDGVQTITTSTAEYVYGQGEQQRLEATWAHEGDDMANRPPRPFIGLTDRARALSADLLSDHLKDNR